MKDTKTKAAKAAAPAPQPHSPPKSPAAPVRTLSDGVANPKQGSGGRFRAGSAKDKADG